MNPLIFRCFPRFGIDLTLNTDGKLGIPVAYCPLVVKKSIVTFHLNKCQDSTNGRIPNVDMTGQPSWGLAIDTLSIV